jgi:hypothetical protein
LRFLLALAHDVVALRRETDAERRALARRDLGEDVDGRLERDRHRRARLLDLLLVRLHGPVVGDRGDRDEHVLGVDAREHGVGHLGGAHDVDAVDAGGRGERRRPATSVTSAPASPRRARARSPSCPSSHW